MEQEAGPGRAPGPGRHGRLPPKRPGPRLCPTRGRAPWSRASPPTTNLCIFSEEETLFSGWS